MRTFEEALEAFMAADRAEAAGGSSSAEREFLAARRLSALRELHAAEDPWTDCLCPACSVHD